MHERRGDVPGALLQWRAVFEAAAPLDLRLHALNNSARLLESLKRYPESEALMRQSLTLKAAQPDVIQHYLHIRQKQCAWPHDLAVGDVTPNQFLMGTSLLAMMGLSDDPALQLLTAQRFVHDKVPKPPATALHQGTPKRQGRIRIGYLSGDLHMHAVGLLTPELFELHDRSRFEVWGFCWTPESQQPQRQRILHALDHLVRLNGVDDSTAAKLIAQACIDVLVDLQGLTSGARPGILVQRPAPVQVSYLGLPGTSAVPGVDWMISAGALIGAVMFATRAVAPLSSVVMLATRYQGARAALRELDRVMSLPVECEPGKVYVPRRELTGRVALVDVGFAYPVPSGHGEPGPVVLKGTTLRLEPGERVAVLGRIESGKSTALRLLAGLYQPTSGHMEVGKWTASTCARSTPPTTARASASWPKTRASSTARCATTCCWTGPAQTRRAWPTSRARPVWTGWYPHTRKAGSCRWAKAARCCRAASGSWWRWRVAWSHGRRFC